MTQFLSSVEEWTVPNVHVTFSVSGYSPSTELTPTVPFGSEDPVLTYFYSQPENIGPLVYGVGATDTIEDAGPEGRNFAEYHTPHRYSDIHDLVSEFDRVRDSVSARSIVDRYLEIYQVQFKLMHEQFHPQASTDVWLRDPFPQVEFFRHNWSERIKFSDAVAIVRRSADPVMPTGYRWAQYLSKQLERFAFSPESIPSPISLEVSMQVLRESFLLLPESMPRPAVVPTREGAVELEWRKGPVHLRIRFQGTSAYAWIDDLKTVIQGPLDDCRESIVEEAHRLSEG